MSSNLERYKADLKKLNDQGERVRRALLKYAMGEDAFLKLLNKEFDNDAGRVEKYLKDVGEFRFVYQDWYTEARAVIKQLAPDRLNDFVRHYEKPKGRKEISFENYRLEDALQGLRLTRLGETVLDSQAAIPHMEQQLAILGSLGARFESSLFDIKQLVQADLFDSELDAARELLKNKFLRPAGAIAGVVLEKHLAQVCENHGVKVKRNPGIADLNDALKAAGVIDVPRWRFIQHLGDYRNLCDHNKGVEPTDDQVRELIDGVAKSSKTLF